MKKNTAYDLPDASEIKLITTGNISNNLKFNFEILFFFFFFFFFFF